MSSNELIDLMREFGVEVRMLGTEEEPSPNGLVLGAMLMEIHRLRNLVNPSGDHEMIDRGLAEAAERPTVTRPDPEDMAETIAEWQDVLGSEGLAKKIIEKHWRAAERGEGDHE